jgi:competence protein ComEA
LVNLNRATVSDFDKLPGLGPTLAARIIDWREANNGFKSIEDLRKVGGIGDKLFSSLRKLVSL